MTTLGNRIKKVRKESKDRTLVEFGKNIGISNSAVSMLESGKNKPSRQTIMAICQGYGVNENWLLTGEGEQYIKPDAHTEITERLANVQLHSINGESDEIRRNAIFKERLANAILGMSDEHCEALIEVIEKLL